MLTKLLVFTTLAAICLADLRMASQPKNNWKAIDRNKKVPFIPPYALYMEPSDFGYEGLQKQRDGGGYDNFLRSNIDNEQDRRKFETEDGKDHLPFRSYEGASTDEESGKTVLRKIPDDEPGPAITAAPGKPYIIPLRWNNPHASELEVNVWIMKNKYVVPIRKPTCSGEGHQDNVFSFTVPNDFNSLADTVPGFKGCKQVGDCVLQVYAHSVESRTYSMGTPFIVTGTVTTPATAPNGDQIEPAYQDKGLDVKSLRPLCLPSNDPSADITSAKAREARLCSDVFNHAYQNSDFSPYSGQQPEAISQNLQYSAILKMVTGNRGELGKALLAKKKGTNGQSVQHFQKKIEKKAKELIRVYETITNQIIAEIGPSPEMMTQDTKLPEKTKTKQTTEICFRCAEVGAVVARRLTTNTYIPSFNIPLNLLLNAKQYLAPKFAHLVDLQTRNLEIYKAAFTDIADLLEEGSRVYNLGYMGCQIKTTLTTMADPTNFKRKNKKDTGPAQDAQKHIKQNMVTKNVVKRISAAFVSSEENSMSENGEDMDALMADSNCDNDATVNLDKPTPCHIPGYNQKRPGQLFQNDVDGEETASSATTHSATAAVVVLTAAVAAWL